MSNHFRLPLWAENKPNNAKYLTNNSGVGRCSNCNKFFSAIKSRDNGRLCPHCKQPLIT